MAKAKPQGEPAAVEPKDGEKAPARRKCGLIMPISATSELPESHWLEMKAIITSALGSDFDVSLVSDSDGGDIIHRRIVHSLYSYEICICDISTLNPNVMFELGIRLTFDRPTVIIRDELTKAPFDVTLIRYLSYPRDLRYRKIMRFKKDLKSWVNNTISGYKSGDKAYSFMKMVGNIKVPDLDTEKVPAVDLLSRRFDDLEAAVFGLSNQLGGSALPAAKPVAKRHSVLSDRYLNETLIPYLHEKPEIKKRLVDWRDIPPRIRTHRLSRISQVIESDLGLFLEPSYLGQIISAML